MKSLFATGIGLAFSIISFVNVTYADGTYTTSKGAVFTQVQGPGSFGKAWKDPSGTLWSSYQGLFTNDAISPDQGLTVADSAATRACARINGNLPSAQQYERLASYFEAGSNHEITDQGKKDLYAIFPDMTDRFFWSASISPDNSDDAYGFDGVLGDVYVSFYDRVLSNSVRCCVQ